MSYSREYKEWTGANVEVTVSICGEPMVEILPNEENDTVKCDGFNIIGLKKLEDGTLMLKIKSENSEGFDLKPYYELEDEYKK